MYIKTFWKNNSDLNTIKKSKAMLFITKTNNLWYIQNNGNALQTCMHNRYDTKYQMQYKSNVSLYTILKWKKSTYKIYIVICNCKIIGYSRYFRTILCNSVRLLESVGTPPVAKLKIDTTFKSCCYLDWINVLHLSVFT